MGWSYTASNYDRLNRRLLLPASVAHVFVSFFSLTGLVFKAADGCDVYGCYDSLRGVLGVVDHQLVFPFYEDHELDQICRAYADTRHCVSTSIGHCKPSDRITFEGFDLAIHYLCNDGYKDYQKQRKCFISKPVIQIAEKCNATYYAQLNDLKKGSKTVAQKTSLLCNHVDELILCVRNGVTEECGKEAGQLIFNLKTTIQKPVKEGIGCVAFTESVSPPPVVFIVIVGALLLVALLLIGAIVHRRLKSTHSNISSSSSPRCFPGCCCRRLRIFSQSCRHSGRLQMMESTTTDGGAMKISSIESESTVTLQGLNTLDRESTTMSKPLLKPVLHAVSEVDPKALDSKGLNNN